MWQEAPGPAQVAMELPLSRSPGSTLLPSNLAALLGVWISFRAGLVVAKQTQCIKRLPKPPAAVFVG